MPCARLTAVDVSPDAAGEPLRGTLEASSASEAR